MAKLVKLGLKHEYHQDNTYYYRRRIPLAALPFYQQRGEYLSGYLQRTLGTSDPKEAPAAWARVHAEVEADWKRIKDHLKNANIPQTLDQIDEATAKALVWKAWLAWQALGMTTTHTMDDFGPWALRVLEKLPPGIEYMTPRAVRDWHATIDQQPQRRFLTQFAQNAVAREVPGMAPALHAMPVLDLGKNSVFAVPVRKPKMLGEVMDEWLEDTRRRNLKAGKGGDKEANKNYAVPFKIMKDVLGENTVISHISRDDIRELVEIIANLPKSAHRLHDHERLSYRDIAAMAKADTDQGDEIEFNADSSINKYLTAVTTLFNFAEREHWIKDHPARGITILGGDRSKRRALTTEELAKLFHRGYAPRVNTWLPILMLFHGCRTNEIAQLDVADIVQRPSGLWCINITDESNQGDKTLKTVQSKRLIPIHRNVVDMGFVQFVESRRQAGHGKLFNVANGSSRCWDSIREDITALFKVVGVYEEGKVVPYSLRHTWKAQMQETKVDKEIREAIGGWSATGSAEKGYGRKEDDRVVRFTPEVLSVELDKLDFPDLFCAASPENWDVGVFERVPTARA